MQEHTRELDIRALLYTMFQKKKYFIYSYLVVGLVLAVFMNYEINVRPTYLSDTIIYVSMQNSTNTDTETDTITSTELNNMKEMTNSFLQIIRSNRLAEKVISQLNLGVSPDSFLSDNLSVQSIESTPFIKISVSWGDSDTAYLINQSVIDSLTAVMNEMKISGRLVVVDGPVKPKQQKILGNTVLAGIFVLSGFCIGFLGVLFNMLLYKGFRTEEDIRGILHLENLGVIPLRKHYTV